MDFGSFATCFPGRFQVSITKDRNNLKPFVAICRETDADGA